MPQIDNVVAHVGSLSDKDVFTFCYRLVHIISHDNLDEEKLHLYLEVTNTLSYNKDIMTALISGMEEVNYNSETRQGFPKPTQAEIDQFKTEIDAILDSA